MQHDMDVGAGGGASVRADFNGALQALATASSGTTAPATTYPYQFWADTTAGVLRQRTADNMSWIVRAPLAETLVVARAANTVLGVGDWGRSIIASGTWPQTFAAAATLGDGWFVEYRNNGTGVITLDPSGVETIDGAPTIQLAPGEACSIYCSGTEFYTVGRTASDIQRQIATAFTSAGAAPAFTLTPVPAITAYVARQRFSCKFHAAGSGSDTLNISGVGAKSIKQYDSAGGKVPAVIAAGQLADVEYDGVDFVVLDALPVSVMPAGIPLDWTGLTPPLWAVVRNGAALSRTAYAALFAALCPQRNGTLTNGANSVTGLSTTLDMWVGMPVEGVGVPAGTTVASITSASAITLSANATVSGAQALTLFPFGYGAGGSATTFGVPDDRGLHVRAYDSGRGYEQSTLTANTTSASNVLTGIVSTRGLFVGMPVSGAGIPASTTISEIVSAVSVKLSANAAATGSAVALTVTGRQVGAEGGDAFQGHTFNLPLAADSLSGSATQNYRPAGGANPAGAPISDGVNGTPRIGAETQVKRRIYLPIITLGA